MSVDQRLIGAITVIDIGGRLSVENGADAFRDTVRHLIRQGRVNLIVDCRDASYVDSTGLGEIVRAYTGVIRHGGSLKLLQVPRFPCCAC
jgi:anti-sigma B factor antagonist